MTIVFFTEVLKKFFLVFGSLFGKKGYNIVINFFEGIQTNISRLNSYQLKQLGESSKAS